MGRSRDFSRETIEFIRENLTDNNAGCHIDKIENDVFPNTASLDKYIDNLNRYYEHICEINDITKQKLDKIVNDVRSVELLYEKRFDTDANNLVQLTNGLKLLSDEIGKKDLEKTFDPYKISEKLADFGMTEKPLDFSGLSPELAAKMIAKLPDDKAAEALELLPVDKLLALPLDGIDGSETLKEIILVKKIDTLIASPEKLVQMSNANRQDIIDYISVKYRGDDVKLVPADERKLLVNCYEINYKANTEVINSFLSGVAKEEEHKEDIQNIKYLAYASPEPYHSVFFKYLPELTLLSHHSHMLMGGEMSFGGLVFIELEPNPYQVNDTYKHKGIDDPRGAYATFFHEVGHGIDFAMSNPDIGVTDFIANPQLGPAGSLLANTGGFLNLGISRFIKSRIYSVAGGAVENLGELLNPVMSRPLNDLIYTDVENRIRQEIVNVCGFSQPLSAVEQADVQTILDSLMKGGIMDSSDPLYADRSSVQEAFGRKADGKTYNENGILSGAKNSGASDAFWGITGKNISGDFGHNQEWNTNDIKDVAQKIRTLPIPGIDVIATVINRLPDDADIFYSDFILPGSEFFADSFSVNMTQYSDSLNSMNTLLPSASSAFQDIMNNDGK